MRKIVFVNGEFYHIYNRGADKRIVFANNYDFQRFLQSVEEFNSVDPIGSIYQNSFCEPQLRRPTSKLVNVVCYCLNPNNYLLFFQNLTSGELRSFRKNLVVVIQNILILSTK